MPVSPFIQMFQSWRENTSLPVVDLQLLALCAMLRPSDIAPRSGRVFRHSMVTVLEDGDLEIYLHGIKNDFKRDSFRIVLPPCRNPQVCPVSALGIYMARTMLQAKVGKHKGNDGPVFVTVKAPFRPLHAEEIGFLLSSTISQAGLCTTKFKPKNFWRDCGYLCRDQP